jgi:transcriptional regulator with XRE-family HTH domain
VDQFREYLRALMDAAGIADYAELSRLTGVNQTQFSNWRRGITQPGRTNLKKIAPVLRVPPALLYVQAGLDQHEDLDITEAPDLTVWPREFHQLHDVYEAYAAAGRADEVLDAVGTLVLGLAARMGTNDQPSRRRRTA